MLMSTSNKESEKEREREREREISFTWACKLLLVNMDREQADMQVVRTSSAFLFPFTIVI